jgi:hypothetical protein
MLGPHDSCPPILPRDKGVKEAAWWNIGVLDLLEVGYMLGAGKNGYRLAGGDGYIWTSPHALIYVGFWEDGKPIEAIWQEFEQESLMQRIRQRFFSWW